MAEKDQDMVQTEDPREGDRKEEERLSGPFILRIVYPPPFFFRIGAWYFELDHGGSRYEFVSRSCAVGRRDTLVGWYHLSAFVPGCSFPLLLCPMGRKEGRKEGEGARGGLYRKKMLGRRLVC